MQIQFGNLRWPKSAEISDKFCKPLLQLQREFLIYSYPLIFISIPFIRRRTPMNSNDRSDSSKDWLPCLPGTLSELEMSFTTRIVKRKSDVFSLGMIYACGVLIFATVILSWSGRTMRGAAISPGQINCEHVRQHLGAYSQMDICDCQLRASISTHLMRCPKCDLIYQGLAGNHVARLPVSTQCDYVPELPTGVGSPVED